MQSCRTPWPILNHSVGPNFVLTVQVQLAHQVVFMIGEGHIIKNSPKAVHGLHNQEPLSNQWNIYRVGCYGLYTILLLAWMLVICFLVPLCGTKQACSPEISAQYVLLVSLRMIFSMILLACTIAMMER